MKRPIYSLIVLIFCSVVIPIMPALAVKHTVLVGNYFFNPSSLNVSVGDTIHWQWSAGSHTTTSGTIPSGAAAWDAPITSGNQVYEYKVTVAGTYNYVCTPHAGMGMVATFTAASFVPTLSVAPANRNVTASAGSTNFTVTSNSSWTSSSNSGWCTVGSGGTGNGSISANYTENTAVTQRIATITIMVAGLPDQTVTVTQAGATPTLAVGPANQNVPEASGNTTFNVNSNTGWTASSSAAWCTVNPSGTGNGTINAAYEANTDHAVRVATISVTVAGLPVQTVTVTQAASTVGINAPGAITVDVYPNPTKGMFRVSAGLSGTAGFVVTLFDISGKRLASEASAAGEDLSFDLSAQPKGLYFIRIETAGSTVVKRLVVTE